MSKSNEMMSQPALARLDRDKVCGKCGSSTVSIRFAKFPDTRGAIVEELLRRDRIGLPHHLGDLMQRQCQECGNLWAELPLDAPKAEGAVE